MPHLGSSSTTVFWAKLRKAAQKFMHTEGSSRHGHSGESPGRRQKAEAVRGWEKGEGGLQVPGQWTCGVGAGGDAGGNSLPYPDIFKHLHGRKGLQGTDKTLRITEAKRQHLGRLAGATEPPFQELACVSGKARGQWGPLLHPPAASPSQVSFKLFIQGSHPVLHPCPEPVEALPLARAVHLLGGLELYIAGGGLCG